MVEVEGDDGEAGGQGHQGDGHPVVQTWGWTYRHTEYCLDNISPAAAHLSAAASPRWAACSPRSPSGTPSWTAGS